MDIVCEKCLKLLRNVLNGQCRFSLPHIDGNGPLHPNYRCYKTVEEVIKGLFFAEPIRSFELVYLYVTIDDETTVYECAGRTFVEAYTKAYVKATTFFPKLSTCDNLTISNSYVCGCIR